VTRLEQARELERQRAAILKEATEQAVARAAEAVNELRVLVAEQLKSRR
jgi:hypothetical protein